MSASKNNDISLFEKVVFVDNIPNEMEAKRLSTKFPFAVFVTTDNDDGPKGIINDNPDGASSNLWKAGKRLTKFINIDEHQKSIGMDTYSIELTFDNDTGLLGIKAVQKIEEYKVVALTYKKKDNTWETNNDNPWEIYINKSEITADIESGKISNITPNDWLTDKDSYKTLSYNDVTNKYLISSIDALDNKCYIVVRYAARDADRLSSVPLTSFNIFTNSDTFEVVGEPQYENDMLQNIVRDLSPALKDEKINKIKKYTSNIIYENSKFAYVYVMYEVNIKDNLLPDTVNDNLWDESFSFGNLGDVFGQFNIQLEEAYVNPQSYRLYINDKEILSNQKPYYLLPGETGKCIVKMTPSNVRPLQLAISDLTNGFIKPNAQLIYNTEGSDGSTDKFLFNITCPANFTYNQTHAENSALSTNLRYVISNDARVREYEEPEQHRSLSYPITQYMFIGLKLTDNPWTPFGVATSGETIGFNSYNVYAKFTDGTGTDNQLVNIPSTDNGMTINIYYNYSLSNGDADHFAKDSSTNIELDTYFVPENATIGQGVTFITPWIKSTNLHNSSTGAQTTDDWIQIEYVYHGCTDYTHKKYIKPDTLVDIKIKREGAGGIYFENESIESGAQVKIKKSDETPIQFIYNNGQIVDGYIWGYGSNKTRLMQAMKIGIEGRGLTENDGSHLKIPANGDGNIVYYSDNARDHANTVVLYLTYQGITSSDYLTLTVEKLIIDWFIYLGTDYQITRRSDPSDINAYDTVTHPTNEELEEIISNSPGPGPRISEAFEAIQITPELTTYKGGLIHLGQVNLEEKNKENPIWKTSENKVIEVNNSGDIDPNLNSDYSYFLAILPEGVTYEDVFGFTNQNTSYNLPIREFRKGYYRQYVVPQEQFGSLWGGFYYTMYYKVSQ